MFYSSNPIFVLFFVVLMLTF